jgi:hypothetical protein
VSDLSPVVKAIIVTVGVLIIMMSAIYFRYGAFDASLPLVVGTTIAAFALSLYGFNRQE